MTSLNSYLDAIKPFAKSIQEKAAKLSDVVDEQLKKTQENLERKRTKVVAETSEADISTRRWKPSTENPLGEFIDTPPIPSPPLAPSPTPERPQRLAVDDHEPRTVSRKKTRRQKKLVELENEIERKQDVRHCLKDLIDQIIENEKSEIHSQQFIFPILHPPSPPPSNGTVKNSPIQTNPTEELPVTSDDIVESSPVQIIPTINIIEEPLITTDDGAQTPCENELTIEENTFDRANSSEYLSSEPPEAELDTDSTFDSSLEKSYACIENFSVLTPDEPVLSTINEYSTESKNLPQTPESVLANGFIPPIKKEKCFSSLNSYSLPSDIIVSHISCSSTQIYICTTKHILFYTRVPETNVYHSLTWYRYNLPADQLLVSPTNKTILRLYDKRIYLSSDTVKLTPLGIHWTELKFHRGENLLSLSITDQSAWFIKQDGTLWLCKIDSENSQPINFDCPFILRRVVCSIDHIGVSTNDGQVLIRSGLTEDCPEGGGWKFIVHNFGPFDDFTLMKNANMLCVIDKKHRIWIHDWTLNERFYEVLKNQDFIFPTRTNPYLMDVNNQFLCFTDCHEQLYIFSNCLTGIHWSLVQKGTRLQRLVGAFPNEDFIWALTTDGNITTSNDQILEKPRQAQYITHASFVPDISFQRIVWSLDESCNIYTRNILDENSQWEQLDQSQFGWSRRLVDIVCNTLGVWAVDDQGCVYFRYGHISSSDDVSFLNAAWIQIPGDPKYHRSFAQIFCGPEDWMVYATDNKQAVYSRIGIEKTNPVGTSWKMIEDCSALGLAISEHTLWLLTSRGRIECHENISLSNPIGTRTTILPGRFNSISVSIDDDRMWALFPPHHLFKLDRLTVLFDK